MAIKLGDLFVKLGLQKGEFDKGLNDAKSQTNAFASTMGKIGGMIAGVFAADKLIQFGKEVFNIAQEVQGVQTAFYKIATSRDLDVLRSSVKGTVSDMELMKRSVIAHNFNIPVQELGKLFAFAAKRAQDTGQSIDYLVDSIVIGIGRKSPLILDNLGISIVDLRKRLGGFSAETATTAQLTKVVGDIAEESFKKTGGILDTLGVKVQTLSANWANFKMSLSTLFSNSDMLKKDLDDWSKLLQIWQAKELTKWDKFLASVSGVQAEKVFNKLLEAKKNAPKETELDEVVVTAKNLQKSETMKKLLDDIAAKQKELNELPKRSVAYYEAEIALLQLKQKLITNPQILEQSKKEIVLKTARLEQLTKELKLIESIKLKNKDIADIFSKGIFAPDKKSKGEQKNGLIISDEMQKNMWNSDAFANKADESVKQVQDYYDSLNQTITDGIGQAITSLASGFGEMLGTGNWDWSNFGAGILDTVGKFMQTLGGLFIAYGIANLKFMQALLAGPTPIGAGLAIAAGVGLIAAGAAISSFSKKGMSTGSSSASSAASGYSNTSQSSALMALSGNVVFEIEGNKLKGVLNNQDRKNSLIR